MAAPPPVLTVAVEKGPRRGEARECRAGAALRVGRVIKGNDLALRDGGASQRHLLVEFLPPPAGAGWAVSDLGTSNGTLLNGAPLAPSVPAPLSHGDRIKVGDSTVLVVSVAPDSDPVPAAGPAPRRASRHAAVVVAEMPPVATRRGTRNKTAAEAPEEPDAAAVVVEEKPAAVTRRGARGKAPPVAEPLEVEKEDAAAVVVVEEKPPAVSRRGTRGKAPPVAEPPKVEKEEPVAAAVVVEEKPQVVARRRGGRKKLAPVGMDNTAEAPHQGEQNKAPEPSEAESDDEEKEEAMVVTRRGSRKSVTAPTKQMEEEKEEAVPAVTRRGGRRKNAVTIDPPPLPPKPKPVRGRGTRATASTSVLQEEQGGNELAGSSAQAVNPLSLTALKGGEEQKVAAGNEGVELEEPTGEMEEDAKAIRHRRQKKVAEHHEPEKDGEETTVVTRRGGRKAVAEQSEPEKDGEETTVVTRRGRQKKVAEQSEREKDVEETTAVMRPGRQKKVVEQPEVVKEDDEKEGAPALTRRGGRKKNALLVAPPSLPQKTSSTRGQGRVTRASMNVKALEEELPKGRARAKPAASNTVAHAAAAELIVEMEKTSEAPRRGRQKKAVKPPEPEKEDEEKENAVEVTRRKGQKKAAVVACQDSAVVAPPPLPPKKGSGRGCRTVTRTSARNNVLEEDAKAEQEEDEVTVPRDQAGNLQIAMAVNGGEDREVKGAARASEDDTPEGRDSEQHAPSENRGKEDQGGAHCSSRVHSGSTGIPNTTSKYREDRKLKAYATPFDVRLDRALKKYST